MSFVTSQPDMTIYHLKPGEDVGFYPWGVLICDRDGYFWLPPNTTVYRFSI